MLSLVRASAIILCLVICVAGAAVSLSTGAPNDDSAVVAVFPPWWPSSRAVAAASDVGAIVDGGAFPFVLIVQSQNPGLGERLRAAGALLLLNPLGFGGCLTSPSRNPNV